MWANEGVTVGLIPSRYPGSETSSDSLVQLARKTEWVEKQTGIYEGLGQRLLATDVDEFSLLDIRNIQFDTPVAK